jgi:hypothetical protein
VNIINLAHNRAGLALVLYRLTLLIIIMQPLYPLPCGSLKRTICQLSTQHLTTRHNNNSPPYNLPILHFATQYISPPLHLDTITFHYNHIDTTACFYLVRSTDSKKEIYHGTVRVCRTWYKTFECRPWTVYSVSVFCTVYVT